jgi:4-carboxymuconolactone decarboxylase
MRLQTPRVAPLAPDQWDAAAKEIIGRLQGEPLNIFKTMANHSELFKRWLVFANHVLGKSTLPVRERELIILRIGYLCKSGYEWGQHVLIARRAKISDAEIRDIKVGPTAKRWSEADRLLLQATDELHADAHIADATWQGLAQHFSTQQLMDIVFTVGQYNLVSMALNSFGVQADPGVPGLDAP